jgi:hypothetical protein
MKPSFEANPDVEKCVEYLMRHDRVSYNELSAHLGRKINGRDRYILIAARRRLERKGILFVVEWGVGLVRATNRQVARLSTDVPIGRIRRIAHKAKKREVHVNVQGLSEDERLAFYVGRVVVNAIGKSTLKSFRSQIKSEIEKHDNEPITLSQVAALRRHRM